MNKIRQVDQDRVEVHRSLLVRKVMLIHWQLDLYIISNEKKI
jgi:hypothetical protein